MESSHIWLQSCQNTVKRFKQIKYTTSCSSNHYGLQRPLNNISAHYRTPLIAIQISKYKPGWPTHLYVEQAPKNFDT